MLTQLSELEETREGMAVSRVEREEDDHLEGGDTDGVWLLEIAGLHLTGGGVVQPEQLTTSVLVHVELLKLYSGKERERGRESAGRWEGGERQREKKRKEGERVYAVRVSKTANCTRRL